MKNLGSVEEFKQVIANRQIKVMHRLGELRKKYLSAVKVLKPNDPPSPGVFNIDSQFDGQAECNNTATRIHQA